MELNARHVMIVIVLAIVGAATVFAFFASGGTSSGAFTTIDTPSGTDPEATVGDTLVLAEGAGITIEGDWGTDTVTISAQFVTKLADETINNSNTLQDDDELSFEIEANEVWICQYYINTNSGTTPDIKLAFAVPAGATGTKGGAGRTALGQSFTHFGQASAEIALQGLGADQLYEGSVLITNGATAGSVTVQWAQNTADMSDTIVRAGSSLLLHKVQ